MATAEELVELAVAEGDGRAGGSHRGAGQAKNLAELAITDQAGGNRGLEELAELTYRHGGRR